MKKNVLFFLFLLISCANGNYNTPENYLENIDIASPTPDHFAHCYQYGCQKIVYAALSPEDQGEIVNIFTPPSKNAPEERERISHAIGLLERIIGAKTGTQVDHYGTFRANGQFQQDCVDESVNTTIYLSLLDRMGLLRYHKVLVPDTRFPLVHGGRWPHRTAVISNKHTQENYAVDSWFHDNGFNAEIVLLKSWKKGWKPESHKRNSSDFQDQP